MGEIKDIGQFALSWKSIEELKTPLWILTAVFALFYVIQILGALIIPGLIFAIILIAMIIALIWAFWKYGINTVLVKALSIKGYTTRTIGFLNYIAYSIMMLIAIFIPWFGGNHLLLQIGAFVLGIIGIGLMTVNMALIGTILAAVGFGVYAYALIYTILRLSLGLPAYLSGTGGIGDALRRSWDVTNENVIESTLIRLGNWIYGIKDVVLFWVVGIALLIAGFLVTLQNINSNNQNPLAMILTLASEIITVYVSIYLCFTAYFGDTAVLAMLEGKTVSKAKKTA